MSEYLNPLKPSAPPLPADNNPELDNQYPAFLFFKEIMQTSFHIFAFLLYFMLSMIIISALLSHIVAFALLLYLVCVSIVTPSYQRVCIAFTDVYINQTVIEGELFGQIQYMYHLFMDYLASDENIKTFCQNMIDLMKYSFPT